MRTGTVMEWVKCYERWSTAMCLFWPKEGLLAIANLYHSFPSTNFLLSLIGLIHFLAQTSSLTLVEEREVAQY